MTSLIKNSSGVQQIAIVVVDVKDLHRNNVATYVSIACKIFKDAESFLAVPVTCAENMRLTNLPKEFSFRFKHKILGISVHGLEEVVEQIIDRLHLLSLIKVPRKFLKNIHEDYAKHNQS